MKMNTLDALKDYLNTVDVRDLNLDNLPKFGGHKPSCSGGIFSWDETRIIVYDHGLGFHIIERQAGDTA